MKTTILIIITCIGLNSLSNTSLAQDPKTNFGIYETKALKELSPLSENMAKYIMNQNLSMDSPVIGYTSFPGMSSVEKIFKKEETAEFNLMATRFSATNSGKSYAIISLENKPLLDNSDINKTVPRKDAVEIRFNSKGAKKWAKMTKANIGKSVAFVINNEIWSLPMVNAEIRAGVALITGIEDEETAKKLSILINSSLKD